MNEEEELGGRISKHTLLLLIVFSVSCNKEKNLEHTALEIIDTCGDDFPAAAFNLEDREYLFSSPDLFMGQPIDYFSEALTNEEQASIEEKFLAGFNQMSKENQEQTYILFLKWCESNKLIQKLNQDFSSEEVFHHLSQFSTLSPLFNNILPERSRVSNRNFSLEDFATLSSAEFHYMHQQLLTTLAKLSQQEYEAAIRDIERSISEVNGMR